jgi:hypothetical protein
MWYPMDRAPRASGTADTVSDRPEMEYIAGCEDIKGWMAKPLKSFHGYYLTMVMSPSHRPSRARVITSGRGE